MFEFQTAMSELTGLPVPNAALYEGPSSVASAAYLAIGVTGRRKLVASRGVHPHSRESLVAYGAGYDSELIEAPLVDGVTEASALAEAIDDETAAVFLQQPNASGRSRTSRRWLRPPKEHGALVVVACDSIAPRSRGRPANPERTSRWGRVSRSATGSTTAVPPSGSSARPRSTSAGCRAGSPARRATWTAAGASSSPSRPASSTSAEKATHNICTAQALNALAGMVHLAWLGSEGSWSWASCSSGEQPTRVSGSPRSTGSSPPCAP